MNVQIILNSEDFCNYSDQYQKLITNLARKMGIDFKYRGNDTMTKLFDRAKKAIRDSKPPHFVKLFQIILIILEPKQHFTQTYYVPLIFSRVRAHQKSWVFIYPKFKAICHYKTL